MSDLPNFPGEDPAKVRATHADCCRSSLLRDATFLVKRNDAVYLFVSEFRHEVVFAVRQAALSQLICVVRRLSAKEQVLGVAARWVVAAMKNVQSCWYGAVRYRVRVSMSQDMHAVAIKRPISSADAAGHPGPAGIRTAALINPLKEAILCERDGKATKAYPTFSHLTALLKRSVIRPILAVERLGRPCILDDQAA